VKKLVLNNYWLLVLIIGVGAMLRFYAVQDIPFTPDEFSALGRLNFDNIQDVLEFGVKPDGHPAGVQVFLYYWTHWFGRSEVLVKLPFLLMGVGTLYYAFAIGKKWFNDSVGLMVASFVAVLQISVMYSQIARPYGSGLFLCLAMVFYWTNIIQNTQKLKASDWLLYILFSALCAYNHHFSLLFAAIVGLTGLVIGTHKHRLQLLFAGILIFTFYIPHLPIFFAQLQTAGIGSWLAPPKSDFFVNYVSYLFHFSWVLVFFTIGLCSNILMYNFQSSRQKMAFVALVWFMSPFLIGYFYSIYRAPLLQYSVLIFSFPFMLFFLFGWAKELSIKKNAFIVLSILMVGSGTLIFERQYYKQFYYSEMFKQHIVDIPSVLTELKKEKYQVIIANYPEIIDHYFEKYEWDFNFYPFIHQTNSINEIVALIDTCSADYIIYGGLDNQPKEIVQIIKAKYPYLVLKKDYIGSDLWVFSTVNSSSNSNESLHYFELNNSFNKVEEGWFGYSDKDIEQSMNNSFVKITSEQEFGAGTEVILSDHIQHKYDVVEANVTFKYIDSLQGEVMIVFDVFNENGNLVWRAGNSLDFIQSNTRKQSIYLALDYNVIETTKNDKIVLKAYIWNKNKLNLKIDHFTISIRKGNRTKYAIWEKF
jgi:hypothetical protein